MKNFDKAIRKYAHSMTNDARYTAEKNAFFTQIGSDNKKMNRARLRTGKLILIAAALCSIIGVSVIAAPMLRNMQYVPGIGFVQNENGAYEIYVTEEEMIIGNISFDRFMRVTANGQSTLLGWSYSMVDYTVDNRLSYMNHSDNVYSYNNRIHAVTENGSYPLEIFEYSPESYVLFVVKNFSAADEFVLNLDGEEQSVKLIDINHSDYDDLSDMVFPSNNGVTLRIASLPGSNRLFAMNAQPFGFSELMEMSKRTEVFTTKSMIITESGTITKFSGASSTGTAYYGSEALPFEVQEGWTGVMLNHFKNENNEKVSSIMIDNLNLEFTLKEELQPVVTLPVMTEGEELTFDPVQIFSGNGFIVTVDSVKPVLTSDNNELIYYYGNVQNNSGYEIENFVLSFDLENINYSSRWYGIAGEEDGVMRYFVAFEKDVLEGVDSVEAKASDLHFTISGDWKIEY